MKHQSSPEERGFYAARAALELAEADFRKQMELTREEFEHLARTQPEKICVVAKISMDAAQAQMIERLDVRMQKLESCMDATLRSCEQIANHIRSIEEDVRKARRKSLRLAWMPLGAMVALVFVVGVALVSYFEWRVRDATATAATIASPGRPQ